MRLFMVCQLGSVMGRKQNGLSQSAFGLPEAGKPVNLTVSPAQIPRADSYTSSGTLPARCGLNGPPLGASQSIPTEGEGDSTPEPALKKRNWPVRADTIREGFLQMQQRSDQNQRTIGFGGLIPLLSVPNCCGTLNSVRGGCAVCRLVNVL